MSRLTLFPINIGYVYHVRFAGSDGGHHAEMCQRCGSLVIDRQRHTRWHAAVDTAATTLLPSDPKGQS